jgi:hypothetical protein
MQTSASETRSKRWHKGERLIDFLKCRVVILVVFISCSGWIVDLLSAWRSGRAAAQHRSNPTHFFSKAEGALKRRDVIEDPSTKSKKNCRVRFCCPATRTHYASTSSTTDVVTVQNQRGAGFTATLLSEGDRALQADSGSLPSCRAFGKQECKPNSI